MLSLNIEQAPEIDCRRDCVNRRRSCVKCTLYDGANSACTEICKRQQFTYFQERLVPESVTDSPARRHWTQQTHGGHTATDGPVYRSMVATQLNLSEPVWPSGKALCW